MNLKQKVIMIHWEHYVNCDWNKEFAGDNFDVETMWNILKNKIDNGVKRYVPLTAGFYNSK